MTVQTFKARSIQEALQMVRESLGPEATILETRTVFAGLLPWFRRPTHVIVSASCEVKIPSAAKLSEALLSAIAKIGLKVI